MAYANIQRTIDAPVDVVFSAVADVRNFSEAVPAIEAVEFLTDTETGVGTRFRETRNMNGKSATVELEVTEYVENERVRLVSDTHGTLWDSVFTVRPLETGTELSLVMEARAHGLFAKVMNPLTKSLVATAIEKDMDAVKTFCEQSR